MTPSKDMPRRTEAGARQSLVAADILNILAEGGLAAGHGVEWLLDNLDRRSEVRT
ncbi:hypothetical protein [Psychromarinibacter sp. S121]|uniref:hypothetical protein n=1 Tax=Psychromarinibacter sp. S121 TaxID=3415127 RepID=UPI003C7B6EFD